MRSPEAKRLFRSTLERLAAWSSARPFRPAGTSAGGAMDEPLLAGAGRRRFPTLGFVIVVAAAALAVGLWATTEVDRRARNAALADAGLSAGPTLSADPPAADLLRAAAEAEARRLNAAAPFSLGPTPEAGAFHLESAALEDRRRATDCLAMAVYYEAGQEPEQGRRAVAQVVLNRVRHPAFPNTVCGVVFQGAHLKTGCQFTFTCDGSLARPPQPLGWVRARRIAEEALAGAVEASVGTATHYHADYVLPPWASRLAKLAQINRHIFYRWPGSAGLETAFTSRYAGAEPLQAVGLAAAAASVPAPVDVGPLVSEPPMDVAPPSAEPFVLAEAPVIAAPVVVLPAASLPVAEPKRAAAVAPPPILARPVSPRW